MARLGLPPNPATQPTCRPTARDAALRQKPARRQPAPPPAPAAKKVLPCQPGGAAAGESRAHTPATWPAGPDKPPTTAPASPTTATARVPDPNPQSPAPAQRKAGWERGW